MSRTTAKDLPRQCFLCGRNGNGDPLDAHHIFGGANRKLSEKYGLVVPLCHRRCHESGPEAVHRNAETMQALHEFGQRLAMDRFDWDVDDFRRVFGKNYLPDDGPSSTASGPPSPEGKAGASSGAAGRFLTGEGRDEGFHITEEVFDFGYVCG